jgi:hypothetical protein
LTKWNVKEVDNFDVQFEKSMMARYLIHVLGDIHQPLHATSLFDDNKFKNGDQGGNLFLIKFQEGIDNLHKLFDSGAGVFKDTLKRPLNKADQDYLDNTAREIMAEFNPKDLPELKNTDFSDWAQESHDISQHFVYPGITYEGTPSQEYLDTAFKIIKRRIALGGYRLAQIFKAVKNAYDKPTAWEEPVHEDHTGEKKGKKEMTEKKFLLKYFLK